MEVQDLEVMWIKVMPKKMPRKFSCILLACIYHTLKTEYLKIRDYLITIIDTVMRQHPECVVIITSDFNQLQNNFIKTHYRFVQVVNVATRGQTILDKIWMNGLLLFPKRGHQNFIKTHYRFVQVVNVAKRGQTILDKIWTNGLLLFPNWGHQTITWFCLNPKRKSQLILDA